MKTLIIVAVFQFDINRQKGPSSPASMGHFSLPEGELSHFSLKYNSLFIQKMVENDLKTGT